MARFRLAVLVALIPAAVATGSSERVATLIHNTTSPQHLRVDTKKDSELRAELDTVDTQILNQIATKDALVADLIAGRTTLAEVTNRFAEMNQTRPECMTVIRQQYEGATDEEKMARNVIDFVTLELAQADASQKSKVLTRLETEFEILRKKSPSTTGSVSLQ